VHDGWQSRLALCDGNQPAQFQNAANSVNAEAGQFDGSGNGGLRHAALNALQDGNLTERGQAGVSAMNPSVCNGMGFRHG